MKDKDLVHKDTKLIVKANNLIEAKYKLTTREQKVILYLISHIKKDDEDFKTYTFPIKQFSEMMGMKNPNFNEIIEIVEKLQGKVFRIKIDDGIKKGTVTISWLSFVFHNETKGTIDVRFDKFLKPYLLQLKSHFTSYELRNVIELKRSYSIRLYELLKQYETIQERTIEIAELRELLGLEDKYSSFGNIKQKILEPAKKELQEKTDILFEYEEFRKGRKVEKIKFLIKKQPLKIQDEQLGLFDEDIELIDYPLYSSVNDLVSKHGYFVDEKTVLRWEQLAMEKWKQDSENKLLYFIDEVNHNTDVKNPIGYITTVLKSKDALNDFVAKRLTKEEKRRQLMLGIEDNAVPLKEQLVINTPLKEREKRKAKLISMLEK